MLLWDHTDWSKLIPSHNKFLATPLPMIRAEFIHYRPYLGQRQWRRYRRVHIIFTTCVCDRVIVQNEEIIRTSWHWEIQWQKAASYHDCYSVRYICCCDNLFVFCLFVCHTRDLCQNGETYHHLTLISHFIACLTLWWNSERRSVKWTGIKILLLLENHLSPISMCLLNHPPDSFFYPCHDQSLPNSQFTRHFITVTIHPM